MIEGLLIALWRMAFRRGKILDTAVPVSAAITLLVFAPETCEKRIDPIGQGAEDASFRGILEVWQISSPIAFKHLFTVVMISCYLVKQPISVAIHSARI